MVLLGVQGVRIREDRKLHEKEVDLSEKKNGLEKVGLMN